MTLDHDVDFDDIQLATAYKVSVAGDKDHEEVAIHLVTTKLRFGLILDAVLSVIAGADRGPAREELGAAAVDLLGRPEDLT